MSRDDNKRPLHIVLTSTQSGWQGGEVQASLLLEGLRQRGHRCTIFARRDGEFAVRMEQAGFAVRTFASRGRSLSAIRQMRRWLCELRPDVLHHNDSHALTGAGLSSLRLRIPARIAARRVAYPIRAPFRFRHFVDRVICISHAARQECLTAGLFADRLVVVPDGVDPSRMKAGDREQGRLSLDLDADQLLLLCVASLTETKGHRDLLAALPTVLRRFPKLQLALAGDGELTAKLQHQADDLRIADHVQFLGYRNDIPNLMHAADLVVLPSRVEGLGSSLIDAMLAKRPIVATDCGGIPDLIGSWSPAQPAVARLVPPASPRELAAALTSAFEERDKSAQLAERGFQRAMQGFTADTMVERTLAAYRDVLMSAAEEQVTAAQRPAA